MKYKLDVAEFEPVKKLNFMQLLTLTEIGSVYFLGDGEIL